MVSTSPSALIVIGMSAGGMPALVRLVAQLPATLPAAILVVQHLVPDIDGELLVSRLRQHTALVCHLARHQEPLVAGHLYLAPPDRHLLAKADHLLVTKGPHENGFRPAADALFRSAAVAFDSHAVGVVLSGTLHDGTAGLEFIKRAGGLTVVQDPAEAEFAGMPESALRQVDIDYVVPLAEMGPLLIRLVGIAAGAGAPVPADVPADLQLEAAIAERVVGSPEEVAQLGRQVPLICPDCGGPLWQLHAGQVPRYRCHTGHVYTAYVLAETTQKKLEESLWVALRMLEERSSLLADLAERGVGSPADRQAERATELKLHINRLREFMLNGN
jgi:two-component system chemotaxis response regulator CheB